MTTCLTFGRRKVANIAAYTSITSGLVKRSRRTLNCKNKTYPVFFDGEWKMNSYFYFNILHLSLYGTLPSEQCGEELV